jgi:hypothetical protein
MRSSSLSRRQARILRVVTFGHNWMEEGAEQLQSETIAKQEKSIPDAALGSRTWDKIFYL